MKIRVLLLTSILLVTRVSHAAQEEKSWIAEHLEKTQKLRRAQQAVLVETARRGQLVQEALQILPPSVARLCHQYAVDDAYLCRYMPLLIDPKDEKSCQTFICDAPAQGPFAISYDTQGLYTLVHDQQVTGLLHETPIHWFNEKPHPRSYTNQNIYRSLNTPGIIDFFNAGDRSVVLRRRQQDAKFRYPKASPFHEIDFDNRRAKIRNEEHWINFWWDEEEPSPYIIKVTLMKNTNPHHLELKVYKINQELLTAFQNCENKELIKTLDTMLDQFHCNETGNWHDVYMDRLRGQPSTLVITHAQNRLLNSQTDPKIQKMIKNFEKNCRIVIEGHPETPRSMRWIDHLGYRFVLAVDGIITWYQRHRRKIVAACIPVTLGAVALFVRHKLRARS